MVAMNSREWREEINQADGEDKVVLTWRRETPRKGIPGVTEVADADGVVIDHFALGVCSARVRAGRCAFLIDACEFQGALTVHHAFGPTVGRAADKVRETGANSEAVHITTVTIRSAWGWTARVCLREGCVEKSFITRALVSVDSAPYGATVQRESVFFLLFKSTYLSLKE